MHRHGNKRYMSLTPSGNDNTHLLTMKFDKRAGEKSLESVQVNISPLRYKNQTSIMGVTGRIAYLVRISIAAKNNFIHPMTCLLETESGPILIGKDVLSADWLLEIVNPTTKPIY